MAALQAEIRRIDLTAIEARRAAGARLGGGIPAVELHFATECQESRQELLATLGERLKVAENERFTQMTVYQAVERQMKILENLRRRQCETYLLEETRREQKQMDELFLLRLSAVGNEAVPRETE
ncbi:MAG: flagellar FliJ family protein [Acidobacteriota bacterium]|nr:flagellar FliJ family protein [Acidobacteriota bacterium]